MTNNKTLGYAIDRMLIMSDSEREIFAKEFLASMSDDEREEFNRQLNEMVTRIVEAFKPIKQSINAAMENIRVSFQPLMNNQEIVSQVRQYMNNRLLT